MNNNDELALPLCYISLVAYYKITMLNQNMEQPPRKTVQPEDIWLCLGQIVRNIDVVAILPERSQWGGVVGV
jgi:hypothetical protein